MEPFTAVILIIIGFSLLFAEVFLPGGILGIIGGIAILIGVGGAFSVDVVFGLWTLIGSLIAGGATFMLLIHCVQHTRFGKHIVLQETAKDWHGYEDSFAQLVGKTGTAHGPLRPAGTVIIDGRRFDVVTQGEMIENGGSVRVIKVAGNRIVVAEEQTDQNHA